MCSRSVQFSGRIGLKIPRLGDSETLTQCDILTSVSSSRHGVYKRGNLALATQPLHQPQDVTGELVALLAQTFDDLRQVKTIAEVAIVAGIAHQELLGLLGGDSLREPIQSGGHLLKAALDSF